MEEEPIDKNYIHFLDMGTEIVNVDQGMMKFRLYPSQFFMDYTSVMDADALSIMLAIIAQVVIDGKPESHQIKFIKDLLKKLKKQLDETVVYEKHNEGNY